MPLGSATVSAVESFAGRLSRHVSGHRCRDAAV